MILPWVAGSTREVTLCIVLLTSLAGFCSRVDYVTVEWLLQPVFGYHALRGLSTPGIWR